VKINSKEAEILVSPVADNHQFVICAARELIKRGAGSAAITMGKEGLLWLEESEGSLWFAHPPELKCRSQVGCGDTTFAGFAHATLNQMHGAEKVRFAAACGAANCLAQRTSRISQKDVENLLPQVSVELA
jgi:fructose-1-phosphate kinase PfkB-like protein